MLSEQKYYTLDELKIGMTVSVRSLSKILGVRILLDKESHVRDKNEIGFGRIVSIGTIEKGDSEKNIVIYNCEDHEELDDWANDSSKVNRMLDISDVNLEVDYKNLNFFESPRCANLPRIIWRMPFGL